jgi:hypothetical protein
MASHSFFASNSFLLWEVILSFYCEVTAESKSKRPACLDSIKKKLSRYSGLYWTSHPFKASRLCVNFPIDSIFYRRVLPAIARIESTSKVEVIVIDFRPVK